MFQSQPQDPSPQNQRRRQMFLLALFALGVLVLGRMGVLDDGGFLGGNLGNTGAEQVRFQPYRDAADLERAMGRAGYDPGAVATGSAESGAGVPRLFVDNLPPDWDSLAEPERQRLFVAALLPLVLSVNDRMEALRARLATVADAPDAGALSDAETEMVADTAAALGVPGLTAGRVADDPVAAAAILAGRIGPLPVGLAIAQAARDSDWGMAAVPAGPTPSAGKGLFGPAGTTWQAAGPFAPPHLPPGRTPGGDPAAGPPDLWSALAVRAMELAAAPEYQAFRDARADLDAQHAPLQGAALAVALEAGAPDRADPAQGAEGRAAEDRAAALQTIVTGHGLDAYDTARLAPPPSLVLVVRPGTRSDADETDGEPGG